MNVSSGRDTLRPTTPPDVISEPRSSRAGQLGDVLLGKGVTLALTALAFLVGLATFIILARGSPLGWKPGVGVGLVLANLSVLLLLGTVLGGRLTRVWVERRRGSAGSRLHVRLVFLFSGVAVAPTIVVACFAVAFFHFGIQSWFNDPVRVSLAESLQVSRGYLEEHRNNVRAVALEMSNDLARAGRFLSADPSVFAEVLNTQTTLRGLTEAVIFEPTTGQVLAAAGIFVGMGMEAPPQSATEQAMRGDVAVLNGGDGTRVRAVVRLESIPPLMLMIGRPIDPAILGYMQRTEQAVAEYQRLDQNRSWLQIAFAWIFAIVALLVLLAAGLIGLVMANQIARPIGTLINAAERVRSGDLSVRVREAATGDEVAGLSRAFNRMTGQLAAQRTELMEAYRQIDERRRFTETVLAGVSAGVIGLDAHGRIELPNRTADELLGLDLLAAAGHPLAEIVPEFGSLIEDVAALPERPRTAEIQIGTPNRRRTLLVRIGAELSAGRPDGFVVTFDDITALQSAQRKAAWADVARRIAHEIKNPLTPIQLSAERLKRRFTKEIKSDPDTFAQCADTIIRHVGDIGRMVDEFSAFARMPQPVIKPEDVGRIVREALMLQKTARPGIVWASDIPERGPVAPCDRRMLRQALTNLLQNATDAIGMREEAQREEAQREEARRDGAGWNDTGQEDGAREAGARRDASPDGGEREDAARENAGHIAVLVAAVADGVRVTVTDNGIGLPLEDRSRLTEPYVTHKPKGTGLGLAIVKKIMEDHGGKLMLDDRPDGPGAVAGLFLPLSPGELAGEVAREVAAGVPAGISDSQPSGAPARDAAPAQSTQVSHGA